MPAFSPIIASLRLTTYKAVQEIVNSGQANTQKEALRIIIAKCKGKVNTGFDKNIKKAYKQYREFKYRYIKDIQGKAITT